MALTAEREAPMRPVGKAAYPVTASTTIYKGDAVMLVSGYAVPGADTSGGIFVGVATTTVVNSGAAGAARVEVYDDGSFPFTAVGAAVATWLGVMVYLNGDATVALAGTTSNDVLCGKVTEVESATRVWVRLDAGGQKWA